MYKEMPKDAMQPHDTWIIAFCPDTDSFFATNQRAFFWETEEEFETEEDAIHYFDKQRHYFTEIENKIMNHIVYGWKQSGKVFLENNNTWYYD